MKWAIALHKAVSSICHTLAIGQIPELCSLHETPSKETLVGVFNSMNSVQIWFLNVNNFLVLYYKKNYALNEKLVYAHFRKF